MCLTNRALGQVKFSRVSGSDWCNLTSEFGFFLGLGLADAERTLQGIRGYVSRVSGSLGFGLIRK